MEEKFYKTIVVILLDLSIITILFLKMFIFQNI